MPYVAGTVLMPYVAGTVLMPYVAGTAPGRPQGSTLLYTYMLAAQADSDPWLLVVPLHVFIIYMYVDGALLVISCVCGGKKKGTSAGALLIYITHPDAKRGARMWEDHNSILPVNTSSLRNSRWRITSVRSLPPFWYHWRSQRSERISSGVKPLWVRVSMSAVSVSVFVIRCSSEWICGFIITVLLPTPGCPL
jgi:hypothetical protein